MAVVNDRPSSLSGLYSALGGEKGRLRNRSGSGSASYVSATVTTVRPMCYGIGSGKNTSSLGILRSARLIYSTVYVAGSPRMRAQYISSSSDTSPSTY